MDWFSLVDPIGWMHPIVLQTPTPKVNVSPDVELLKSQLEFLKADHARLAADFSERMKQLTTQSASVGDDFKTYLNYVFGVIVFVTGVTGWFGWRSVEEMKASLQKTIDRQLAQAVADTVDREIQMVRRSITREQVISKTSVDYFLENGLEQTREIDLIRSRGFKQIQFFDRLGKLCSHTADLVVVDFEHWKPEGGIRFADLAPDKQEERTKKLMQELVKELPNSILVVYFNGRIPCLNTFPNNQVIMAGSEISLIGNLADAAYVASAIVPIP